LLSPASREKDAAEAFLYYQQTYGPHQKGNAMAKSNYDFQRRQKELAKKKKKEEKRQRKQRNKSIETDETEDTENR